MKAMSEILEEHRMFYGMVEDTVYLTCEAEGCGWEASQESIEDGTLWAKAGNHQADLLKAEGYGRAVMGYPDFEAIIRDTWGKCDELREHSRGLALKVGKLASENAELRQRVADLST